MVHSSIMWIASYECLPFTKSQTAQEPVMGGMIAASHPQRTSDCFLARCDLLIWVGPQFVLYPHILYCSFPKKTRDWTSPKSRPGEDGSGGMRWFCRLCTCQGADKKTEDDEEGK